MNLISRASRMLAAACGLVFALTCPADARAATSEGEIRLIELEGTAEVMAAGASTWVFTRTNQILYPHDRLRLGDNSRAGLLWSDKSVIRFGELTELEILPRHEERALPGLRLVMGVISFFHRDEPGRIRVITRGALAGIEGTEFVMAVETETNTERTSISVIDGKVRFSNAAGDLVLTNRERAMAEPGKAPVRSPGIQVNNVLQWCFYYPAVLDLNDLALPLATEAKLSRSLSAYRSGDLLTALSTYPADQPQSDAEQLYYAGLLLSVGQVEKTESALSAFGANSSESIQRLAGALRVLIAAVKGQTNSSVLSPQLATELLASSYYQQSLGLGDASLKRALLMARQAADRSAEFGFAWARVAELEFSFGRTGAALAALNRSLALAPRNAQAVALKGFLLAAQNRIGAAVKQFDLAIALDGALGNAWLGRGLCQIHQGRTEAGREDLQIAAAFEPNRAILRSYLGKALNQVGDEPRARHELDLSRQLDPNDPTPWLYLALMQYDHYQIADAINSLDRSQQLNDNRAVYRSRLLLDEDQAVRSANLANIYADASMRDVSVRESARAVSLDYANFSAHLNLADSFNELRDPTRFNLRYESEWFNEHLLASLLAPPGAGSLSQNLSQQEYARLFASDHFGLLSTTEYLSTGQYRETATQFGTFGNTSYALDLEYQHNDGERVNNGLDRIEWYSRIKQQVTPHDSLLLLAKYQDYNSGDNFQYYNSSSARPAFHYMETQEPLLLAGWHHEWSPGIHTLFLGGRLVNDQNLSDTNANQLIAVVNPPNLFDPNTVVPFDVHYHSEFETYSAELNQIIEREKHTDVFGARYQDGTFRANNTFDNPPAAFTSLFSLPSVSRSDSNFRRLSLYEYHHWEIVDGLLLIGGLTYDKLQYPANYRRPPLNSKELEHSQVSPKAALLWDITRRLRFRAVYAQAVGGVSYDESVRLEPTQLAGFSQSFRTLISESLAGSVEAPRYDIAAGALDIRPWTNAWLNLHAEYLRERVDHEFGIFNYDAFAAPAAAPGTATERLNYHEVNAGLVFNQIVGREWFLEAQYVFTHSELGRTLPDISATPAFNRTTRTEADLHRFGFAATWQHPSGFFARSEFWELIQRTGGSAAQPPGDDLPLLNVFAGYRFPHRRGELTIGVINLCGEDYHFNPLNYHEEYPHKRAFYTRLRFNF